MLQPLQHVFGGGLHPPGFRVLGVLGEEVPEPRLPGRHPFGELLDGRGLLFFLEIDFLQPLLLAGEILVFRPLSPYGLFLQLHIVVIIPLEAYKLSLPDLHNPGAEGVQQRPVMADDDHGVQLQELLLQKGDSLHVQVGRGLVQEHQHLPAAEHPGQPHPGILAAADRLLPYLVLNPHGLHFLPLQFKGVDSFGELPEKMDVAHPLHGAGIRLQLPGQHPQEGGLPRAVGPHQADALPLVYREPVNVQDFLFPET